MGAWANKLHPGLYILPGLFFFSFITGLSQRTFYTDGVSNWDISYLPASTVDHTVIVVGDIKYPSKDLTVIKMVEEHLKAIQKNGTLVIPGDLVYPTGLPDEDDKGYEAARSNLDALLSILSEFKGNLILMPGNHDWQRGGSEGWDHVKNEQAYIEEFLNRDAVFYPGGGCPGPAEIPLTDDLTAVVFDTQWWFQKNKKPGPDEDCDFEDEAGLFIQMEDILRRNADKKVLIVGHHPLFSVGNHGGYFHPTRLLFPLLDVHPALYVPLPGFLYTGYRKYLGSIQDLVHPEYKNLKSRLLDIFSQHPNLLYVAGHEHNMQYVQSGDLHHLVSGGGGEGTYIAKREKKTDFAIASKGIALLKYYSNGDVWLENRIPDETVEGRLVFRWKLFNKPVYDPGEKEESLTAIDFRDSTVQVRLNDIYNKGKFVRFWMGDNYREIWNLPVELPVFDIGAEKGGLKILKRGGGQQTRSVRLEDNEGRQYVLRSVNKYIEKAISPEMRNTIAADAVQDAISASHPFAAVTVPQLADAAGVMHTNPKLFWIPDDPRLGQYREDLANDVFLFEERPDDNREDVASFRRSKKIVSTAKVVEKTLEEQDHQVDQKSVVRARIFDLLLNDWDRHDDQWRWASFKNDGIRTYYPIPRDRDQVYFVNKGVIMWLARQDFIQPKFQGFDYRIRNVRGLGYNARYFDRYFMTEPDLSDWLSIAASIRNKVSDSIIEAAIQSMPEEAYDASCSSIENKLMSRRNSLDQYAEGLYRFLAKEVDVVGTEEREWFLVKRLGNGNTSVTVMALSDKKGKVKDSLFHREFYFDETREIRLYGLKGKDKFEIDGEAPKGIKIRIIGGKSNDSIIDRSRIRRPGKTVLVYDRKDKNNVILGGKETRLKLNRSKSVNKYNREQYIYDKVIPLFGAGYNIDDGVYIGGGVHIKTYNFRDSSFHKISGTLAFQTRAFSLEYEGLISSFTRFFDLEVSARLSAPRNVDNFFGIGNETKRFTSDKSFFRVRYDYTMVNPRLKHTVSKDLHYSFGIFYQYFHVSDTANRFIGNQEISNLDTAAYLEHYFTGLNGALILDTRNNEVLPTRGIHWVTKLNGFYGLNKEAKNFVRLQSDLRFYLSFRSDPRVVFAFRFGGGFNFGEYEFYQANFLGGNTNLRGYRSNRFAGDYTVYQNTEMRIKLMNLKTYIFNGQTGIYLFNDLGRVWVKDEKSTHWHDGFGAGIWLTPFEFTALTFSYNMSHEDRLFMFSFRFLF